MGASQSLLPPIEARGSLRLKPVPSPKSYTLREEGLCLFWSMLYLCLSVWHIIGSSQKAEFRQKHFRIDAALFKQRGWAIQKILTH